VSTLALALRLARRDLRGGARGFRAALVALAVGVAAIAGVGALDRAIKDAMRGQARMLLGGDLSVQTTMAEPPAAALAFLAASGRVSAATELYGMAAGPDGRAILAAVKAVDGAYPLLGEVRLDPPMPLDQALAVVDGVPGALPHPALAEALGVKPGDTITLGNATLAVRALLAGEPDRAASPFLLGERLMLGQAGLDASGLVQPGSLVRHAWRVVLAPGTDPRAWADAAMARFPDAGWRIVRPDEANTQLSRILNRVGTYLTLVGLGALVVGGIGVAGAARTYLEGKTETIATLKALGASGSLILTLYLAEILALAALGVIAGAAAGALVPGIVAWAAPAALPVVVGWAPRPGPLALAAAFGMLVALVFALWPLGRAREVPAAALFRESAARAGGRPRTATVAAILVLTALLVAVAVQASGNAELTLWFAGATLAALAGLRGLAHLLARAARGAGHRRHPVLRLALAGLSRPGAATAPVVMALGTGLALLATVTQLEGNLRREIVQVLPAEAPSFFFLDIQPAQREPFAALVEAVPGGAIVGSVPALRGRIVAIDGVPVEKAAIDPKARWAIENDRGVTFAAAPPEGSDVVEGTWWPADYAGPPLVSLDARIAEGFGIAVGDRLTVSVLGRAIEATVANLRRIEWETLAINFTLVFDPGTLAAAPHTMIATVTVPPAQEAALRMAVVRALPNVSAVGVSDVLAKVAGIVDQAGAALAGAAAVAIAAGILVLGQAVAADQRRRTYDAVVLKILGATRAQVGAAFALEHAVLGLATGAIGAAIGAAGAWAVMTYLLDGGFALLTAELALVVGLGVAAPLALGGWGTWKALGARAAPTLRAA